MVFPPFEFHVIRLTYFDRNICALYVQYSLYLFYIVRRNVNCVWFLYIRPKILVISRCFFLSFTRSITFNIQSCFRCCFIRWILQYFFLSRSYELTWCKCVRFSLHRNVILSQCYFVLVLMFVCSQQPVQNTMEWTNIHKTFFWFVILVETNVFIPQIKRKFVRVFFSNDLKDAYKWCNKVSDFESNTCFFFFLCRKTKRIKKSRATGDHCISLEEES